MPRCHYCRFGHKPPKPTEAHLRWWRARFTDAELGELGRMIWPHK
jgi:hypothetical protein